MAPTFFAIVVVAAGLFASRVGALYFQVVFCLFGAAAAINLPALGGAVIAPAVLFLPFLAVRAVAEQHGHHYLSRVPLAGVWLICLVLYGSVTAFFLPRLFDGIQIIAVDRGGTGWDLTLRPLHPVSGNVTQSSYAAGALATFLSVHALLQQRGRLEHFRDAILLLASLHCAAAAYNLGEYHLGLPHILDYVRNAYRVFASYEFRGTGMLRIHGTFTEAAAFSGFSLPLVAFTFSLWLHKVRPFYTGTLTLLLLTFLLLSTSTTAYLALCIYGVMVMFVLAYRGYVDGVVPRIGLLVAWALLALVVVGTPFVLETEIARQLETYFQITVFSKLDSASGIERGFWNRQAWSNFLDSYGLGVGLGSVRASSLALVLLSNVGLVGFVLFFAFVRRVLIGARGTSSPAIVSEAARQAVLAMLSAAVPVGTVFDLGTLFYALAAAACVAHVAERPPTAYARQARRGRAAEPMSRGPVPITNSH